MKKLMAVLAIAIVCATTFAAPPTQYPHPSFDAPIALVRSTHLPNHRDITIGAAVSHQLSSPKWTTFITQEGVTIVQVDGTVTFAQLFRVTPSSPIPLCLNTPDCLSALKQFDQYCSSKDGLDKFTTKDACLKDALTAAAPITIPISIQFTYDPPTQTTTYLATDPSWTDDEALNFIYSK